MYGHYNKILRVGEQVILCLAHLYLISRLYLFWQNYKKGLKFFFYDILGVFLSNVLSKRRIWDMIDQSEAILSGWNEQILLTQ